jgi:hypothetical protein
MGYKILGYVVWRAGKWYVQRRFPHARRNLAIASGIGVMLAGGAVAFVAARRRANAG